MPGTPTVHHLRRPQDIQTGAKPCPVSQVGDDSVCEIVLAQKWLMVLWVITEFHLGNQSFTQQTFLYLLLPSQAELQQQEASYLGPWCARSMACFYAGLLVLFVWKMEAQRPSNRPEVMQLTGGRARTSAHMCLSPNPKLVPSGLYSSLCYIVCHCWSRALCTRAWRPGRQDGRQLEWVQA